jgi:hypothetical protein
MRIIFGLLFLFFATVELDAAAQLGITPCVIGQQPADLTFSGTSANRQLSTCGETLIVYNNSSSDARFRIGTGSSLTALTTDLLLAQKTFLILSVGTAGLYFAAIGSGGGTISFVQGTASN